MMLWNRPEHAQCISGGLTSGQLNYSSRSYPTSTVPVWSLFPTMLLLRMNSVLIQSTSQQCCSVSFAHYRWYVHWWNGNASCLHTHIHPRMVPLYAVDTSQLYWENRLWLLDSSTGVYRNLMYLAEICMVPFHTARLSVDWHSPDWSANSLWNDSVARTSSVDSTCRAWLLAVLRSKRGHNSTHSSKRISLRNLKWLMMSHSSSSARQFCQSPKTCSLCTAPFAMSFTSAKAAIVVLPRFMHAFISPYLITNTWGC